MKVTITYNDGAETTVRRLDDGKLVVAVDELGEVRCDPFEMDLDGDVMKQVFCVKVNDGDRDIFSLYRWSNEPKENK